MAKSTKTLSEKMQEALQRKAKAERQIALLKTRDRKADDKAKILIGVMITKTVKEIPDYYKTIQELASVYLKEADQKIALDYLSRQMEEAQTTVPQSEGNNQPRQSQQPDQA